MWWFSDIWAVYLAQCQRSGVEMARAWRVLAGFPAPESVGQSSFPFAPDFFAQAWPDIPALAWLPRIEARIEPLTLEGATKAARLSMRVFMPWSEPFWVEALIGRQADGAQPLPPQAGAFLPEGD
jgi:hypothetical protein